MTLDTLCECLQGKLDLLQEAVDDARNGEHDESSLWQIVDKVCQEIAYLSDLDDEDDAAESDDDGELDFDEDGGDEDEDSDDFDEDDDE